MTNSLDAATLLSVGQSASSGVLATPRQEELGNAKLQEKEFDALPVDDSPTTAQKDPQVFRADSNEVNCRGVRIFKRTKFSGKGGRGP